MHPRYGLVAKDNVAVTLATDACIETKSLRASGPSGVFDLQQQAGRWTGRHRVAVFGGDRPGVLDLGTGLTGASDFDSPPIEAGLKNTIGLIARDDGLILSSEADAGEVLVRLRRLSGRRLVDAGIPPARLPSPPSFLAVGNFFGGDADLFAVLALGTVVRPDLAAIYAVGGGTNGSYFAGGVVVPACAPAAACSDALAVDLDGDGFLEVLTSVDGIAVILRFR